MRKFGAMLLLTLLVTVGCGQKDDSGSATPDDAGGDDTSAVTLPENTQLVKLNLPGMT